MSCSEVFSWPPLNCTQQGVPGVSGNSSQPFLLGVVVSAYRRGSCAPPLFPGIGWLNSQGTWIHLPTMQSQSSTHACLSLQYKPSQGTPSNNNNKKFLLCKDPVSLLLRSKQKVLQSQPHVRLWSLHSKAGAENPSSPHAPNSPQCGSKIPYLLLTTPQDGAVGAAPQVRGGISTPHSRWKNPIPLSHTTKFSCYLGLCTLPCRKWEGPSKSLQGAALRPPIFGAKHHSQSPRWTSPTGAANIRCILSLRR